MTKDIKDALTDIAETNCNIIGLTCAAAVDHIEHLESSPATELTDSQVWKLVNGIHTIWDCGFSQAEAITTTRSLLATLFKGAA